MFGLGDGGDGADAAGGGVAEAVRRALGTVGGAAERSAAWAGERSGAAMARGRSWMEFCDLSAVKVTAEGGAEEYATRLKANAQYFKVCGCVVLCVCGMETEEEEEEQVALTDMLCVCFVSIP